MVGGRRQGIDGLDLLGDSHRLLGMKFRIPDHATSNLDLTGSSLL